jgi:hypothetical protein
MIHNSFWLSAAFGNVHKNEVKQAGAAVEDCSKTIHKTLLKKVLKIVR